MFDIPSVRLGKLFGIPIEVNLTWLVIFGLVSFALGGTYFPSLPAASGSRPWLHYLVGSITALLFFASILAHELCHSLVARAEGGHVDKITLFIFGGVAEIDQEPETPGREFLMAAAGPGMSLVLALLAFMGFALTVSRGAPWWIWAPLQYLAGINFVVALFNLLPGFPLDGGRVLRSILWGITGDLLRATKWAVRVGQVIGWSMVVLAIVRVLSGDVGLIWFGLVGWFIASLAGQAYRQQLLKSSIEGLTVSSIMTPSPEYVDGEQPLEDLVNEHFLGKPHSRYPVIHHGSIVGLVTLPDVKAVARTEWPFVKTIDVADRDLQRLVVSQDAPVDAVIARLAGDRPGALLVVGEGRLTGIVTRSDVIDVLQAARDR